MLYVAGFGLQNENGGLPDILQELAIPVIDFETCNSKYYKDEVSG